MGEVPVLEHAGKRLSQSGVILHYLADHFRKFQGEDRQEVLRWILWDNHKLTSYIATLRFLVQFQKNRRNPGDRIPARPHQGVARESSTSTLRPTLSRCAMSPALPISRCAATCTGRTNSAYLGPTTRASARGWSASASCPAGCIRTS
jgi:hypothetical protein